MFIYDRGWKVVLDEFYGYEGPMSKEERVWTINVMVQQSVFIKDILPPSSVS